MSFHLVSYLDGKIGRKKQQQNQAKLQTQQEKGKDKNIQRKQTQKL